MTPTKVETRTDEAVRPAVSRRSGRSRPLALVLPLVLLLAACGSTPTSELPTAAPPDSQPPAPTEPATGEATTGAEDGEAAEALERALVELGSGYRFRSDLTTAGGGHVAIDGYRLDEAMAFDLTVGDLTVETVARDGRLWTRPVGGDEWASDAWNGSDDPIAPLRRPVRIGPNGRPGHLLATYQGAALGLGVDEMVEVQVTLDDGKVRFATESDRVQMVSVLIADDGLPTIVAPE